MEYREGKGRRWRDMRTVYNIHNKKKRKTVQDYVSPQLYRFLLEAEDNLPVCPV